MMGVMALGGAGAIVATAAHGVWYRNSPVFGRVLRDVRSASRPDAPAVALTFDDGPNPDATPAILDALAARGVKATFFVLGRHAERWPDLVRRVAAEGHTIGNHGWHHRKLHVHGPAYVREDLEAGTSAIMAAAGVKPRFFRAPHGFRAPWVTPIARSLGQRTVGWSLGVWDSDRPGADVIARRTVEGTRPGSILLLHDGDGYDPDGDRTQTAAAVPQIVDALVGRGYRFVTLAAA